ncbi:hypothetical protein DKX38_021073 [Salix brachista]|uniref:RRM domain-containing protein n=1 Tax=Salix brachista TaxID=2182728 RepID=A0A5N5K8F9_9ROSI|nr:hypothetical protein DKX38_021073 [Salix brachista]
MEVIVHTVVSCAMNDLFRAKFCDFSEGLLVLVFEWDRVELLLRKFELLSGFANICNGLETFLHVCSPSPFTHRWNHPVFSLLDHLSLTHFTALTMHFTRVVGVLLFIYRMTADAIRGLDNIPSGYDRRRLSVEWARGEHGWHRDGPRMTVNQRPTKTLFVINFNPIHLRVEDIKRHFECYGEVLDVRIRLNFAFVQFETQEDATKALHCMHMIVVSVEYALRDDMHDRHRSPDYGRNRSPEYGRHGRFLNAVLFSYFVIQSIASLKINSMKNDRKLSAWFCAPSLV